MIRLGQQALGTRYSIGAIVTPTPTVWVRWQIYCYHGSGGLKKLINVGQENDYLLSFNFENNLFGCGAGSIEFGYIDFPIDADDYIKIYFNGVLKYYGIVEITPDVKGGIIQLIPLWERTKERLLLSSKTYTAQTVLQILTDLFTVQCTDSGIIWNLALVDTGSAVTYTVTYSYETLEKIINDMMGKLSSDRYYGVDENGYFFIKQLESSVSSTLFYTDYPAYTEIETSTDTSGIKATKYQVYIKNTGSSGSTRAGQVGYGSGYNALAVENIFRKKEDKLTVPDEIGAGGITNALNYAYALLQSYTALQPIDVKGVQLDLFQPIIGKLITVQDHDETILNTIIDCETVTGWTNATLDTALYCEGSASVKFTSASIGDYIEFPFSHQTYLNNPKKIGFMISSSAASGIFMSVKIYMGYTELANSDGIGVCGMGADGIGDGSGSGSVETILTNTINISSVASWYYFDFPCTIPITKIRFETTATPSQSTQINIDRVQCFQTYAKTYTKNVVQINYSVTPEDEDVTVKLNTYDRAANAELQKYKDQINAINTVITN